MSDVNFTGLPRTMYGRTLEGLKARDLVTITNDAGNLAKVKANVNCKEILKNNPTLFNQDGLITKDGVKTLQKETGCANNCRSLRDIMMDFMKKHKSENVNYNIIV